MANVNRTNDITEQRHVIAFSNFSMALTSGETGVLAFIPYPCHMHAVNMAAFSVESNPNMLLTINRFVVGQGFTSWAVGTTFALPSYGTSGAMVNGVSLGTLGGTLLTLMPGDVVGYQMGGGATAAVFGLAGSIVLRALQDIKVYLGYA